MKKEYEVELGSVMTLLVTYTGLPKAFGYHMGTFAKADSILNMSAVCLCFHR